MTLFAPTAGQRARRRVATGLLLALACSVIACFATGCRLMRSGGAGTAPTTAAPVVLQPGATAQQVIAAVNQNSARVHSYSAPNATFTTPAMPVGRLRGSVVLERPRRFRLRAGTALTGGEVDLGSNDERFWMWAKRNEPPALYFARHTDHGLGAARELLPIDPAWVVDALGLVTLDATAPTQPPIVRPNGQIELRQSVTGPLGPVTRVSVVDPAHAWVVEQQVIGAGGQVLAAAAAKEFRYYVEAGASLPSEVTVQVPTAGLTLTVRTGGVSVNTPLGSQSPHWQMPVMDGYPTVDLGQVGGAPIAGAAPSVAAPMVGSPIVGTPMPPSTVYSRMAPAASAPNAAPSVARLPATTPTTPIAPPPTWR
ncbi:MAG: hypothetical protein AAGJ46_17955 [Planctomycetota bacterium]